MQPPHFRIYNKKKVVHQSGQPLFIARCEVLSSGDLELVDSDAGEVLDEFGGDGHLEFLGEELDAVLGTEIVKDKRGGEGQEKVRGGQGAVSWPILFSCWQGLPRKR